MSLTLTSDLYGGQSFDGLLDLGCMAVYDLHISMLNKTLRVSTDRGDYNRVFKVQRAIKFFEQLKGQANGARSEDTEKDSQLP